jgi:hypothetical protein
MKTCQQGIPIKAIRSTLFALLLLGMVGSGTELVLLNHMEDRLQWVPIILILIGLSASAWHGFRSTALSVRFIQWMFLAFIAAGLAGIYFHYRGSVEFRLESNPSLKGWGLFWQAIFSKAPPLLAPGSMIQLGLLGLVYTYRHPATKRSSENVKSAEGD